jgi:hypothetical protein
MHNSTEKIQLLAEDESTISQSVRDMESLQPERRVIFKYNHTAIILHVMLVILYTTGTILYVRTAQHSCYQATSIYRTSQI